LTYHTQYSLLGFSKEGFDSLGGSGEKKDCEEFSRKIPMNIDFAGVLVMKILHMIVFFEGFITNVFPRKQE
jgi:hypothetical protein